MLPTERLDHDIPSDAADILKEGGTLQRIQTTHTTAIAVQKPRNLDVVVAGLQKECDYAGSNFYYSWPVGDADKRVEGPSIGMAMALVRNWTNCAMEVHDVRDLPDGRQEFVVAFVDLESGVTIPRVYRHASSPPPSKFAANPEESARWADMQFQAGQSKALRNAALAGVPQWLVNMGMVRAKEAELKNISHTGVAEARRRAIDWWTNKGVKEGQIKDYLGVTSLEEIGADLVAKLNGAAHAVHNGEVTIASLFTQDTKPSPPEAEGVKDKLAKAFSPDDLTDLRLSVAQATAACGDPTVLAQVAALDGAADIPTMPADALDAAAKLLGEWL